nr:hypothetical protein [Tanacetum cinerariifolium]
MDKCPFDFDEDFDLLFAQPSKGPSQLIEDVSPVRRLRPSKVTDSKDVEVQDVRPIGRERLTRKDHPPLHVRHLQFQLITVLLTRCSVNSQRLQRCIFVKEAIILCVFKNKGAGIGNGRSKASRASEIEETKACTTGKF